MRSDVSSSFPEDDGEDDDRCDENDDDDVIRRGKQTRVNDLDQPTATSGVVNAMMMTRAAIISR